MGTIAVEAGVVTKLGRSVAGHLYLVYTDDSGNKYSISGEPLNGAVYGTINPHFPDWNGKIWQFRWYSVAISA